MGIPDDGIRVAGIRVPGIRMTGMPFIVVVGMVVRYTGSDRGAG
jgi:hypothetical protein